MICRFVTWLFLVVCRWNDIGIVRLLVLIVVLLMLKQCFGLSLLIELLVALRKSNWTQLWKF